MDETLGTLYTLAVRHLTDMGKTWHAERISRAWSEDHLTIELFLGVLDSLSLEEKQALRERLTGERGPS